MWSVDRKFLFQPSGFSFHSKQTLSWSHLSMPSLTSSHFVDSILRTMNSLCAVSLMLLTAILKSQCSSVVSPALPWRAMNFSQICLARPKRESGISPREILPRWQNSPSNLRRITQQFAFASSMRQPAMTVIFAQVLSIWRFVKIASMPTLSTSLLIK